MSESSSLGDAGGHCGFQPTRRATDSRLPARTRHLPLWTTNTGGERITEALNIHRWTYLDSISGHHRHSPNFQLAVWVGSSLGFEVQLWQETVNQYIGAENFSNSESSLTFRCQHKPQEKHLWRTFWERWHLCLSFSFNTVYVCLYIQLYTLILFIDWRILEDDRVCGSAPPGLQGCVYPWGNWWYSGKSVSEPLFTVLQSFWLLNCKIHA